MIQPFHLSKLFLGEIQTPRWKLFLYSIIAAASSVMLLAIINLAAEHASNKNLNLYAVIQFFSCLALYYCSQKFVWTAATKEVESLVESVRLRIYRKITKCRLIDLEEYGKGELYSAINQHTNTISISSNPIIFTLQSLVMLFFTLIYLATLSITAFLLTLAVLVGLGFFAKYRSKRIISTLKRAARSEQEVFYALGDLLDGFKEVKLHKNRQEDLIKRTNKLAKSAKNQRMNANLAMTDNFLGTQSSFYLLLAILVFCIPQLNVAAYPEMIEKVATVGLFLMGPITNIVGIMPTISNAALAYESITEVESRLDSIQEHLSIEKTIQEFSRIEVSEVSKNYPDRNSSKFSLGPISVNIEKNEIIFVTGGNGAGKSTFIKILLGLYQADSGDITLNNSKLHSGNIISYRNLFSTVLTDYHLFPQAFGIPSIDEHLVQTYLKKMGLEGLVDFKNQQFSTTKLSTGQRKRLALIVAILENRPILIFDEWAADQDPNFRKVFYEEIIPELKDQGRTVIAVTHDEKYFHCADRHWQMNLGTLTEVK